MVSDKDEIAQFQIASFGIVAGKHVQFHLFRHNYTAYLFSQDNPMTTLINRISPSVLAGVNERKNIPATKPPDQSLIIMPRLFPVAHVIRPMDI